jgi:uncharacterized protein
MPRIWVAALVLAAAPLAALEVPPTPTRYFTDLAGIAAADRAAEAEARLAALEQQTGHQVIAVIFPSLGGEALEDFTVRCAEAWRVGRKGLDDGVILFAFVDDRRMRLEVGYGLEGTIPDAVASRLLRDVVRPQFASGDYSGGVVALAEALERLFRGEPPPERQERRGSPLPFLIMLVLVLVLLSVAGRASRHGRRSAGWGGRRRGGGIYWGGGGWGGGGWSGGGGFSAGGGGFGGGGASGSW